MSALAALLQAHVEYGKSNLREMGLAMFTMYTQNGLPPDIFLDELEKKTPLPLLAKVFIVSEYQSRVMEHKRLAGATDKNIDRTRQKNLRDMEHLVKTGELGTYS